MKHSINIPRELNNNAVIDMQQETAPINVNITASNEQSCFIDRTFVSRVVNECGTYVKWLNSFGGYSYWLFNSITEEHSKTKSLGTIRKLVGNQSESLNTFKHLGFAQEKSYRLESILPIPAEEIEEVKTLLTSQEVYLYLAERFSTESKWQKIIVQEGSVKNIQNKVGVYTFEFTYQLHNVKTQKDLWQ
ncbi:hypothetical protein [Capnocytophaga canis]|uniref:hypothetical protein n=1 Tax=Capnocytophaga canis TaxID=1848903 RepID=UPI0037D5148F